MEVEKLKGVCMHVLCGYKHRDIAAKFGISASLVSIIKHRRNYSEPYCPKIMSGVPSKAAFKALTAFMPFFLAVPM